MDISHRILLVPYEFRHSLTKRRRSSLKTNINSGDLNEDCQSNTLTLLLSKKPFGKEKSSRQNSHKT